MNACLIFAQHFVVCKLAWFSLSPHPILSLPLLLPCDLCGIIVGYRYSEVPGLGPKGESWNLSLNLRVQPLPAQSVLAELVREREI